MKSVTHILGSHPSKYILITCFVIALVVGCNSNQSDPQNSVSNRSDDWGLLGESATLDPEFSIITFQAPTAISSANSANSEAETPLPTYTINPEAIAVENSPLTNEEDKPIETPTRIDCDKQIEQCDSPEISITSSSLPIGQGTSLPPESTAETLPTSTIIAPTFTPNFVATSTPAIVIPPSPTIYAPPTITNTPKSNRPTNTPRPTVIPSATNTPLPPTITNTPKTNDDSGGSGNTSNSGGGGTNPTPQSTPRLTSTPRTRPLTATPTDTPFPTATPIITVDNVPRFPETPSTTFNRDEFAQILEQVRQSFHDFQLNWVPILLEERDRNRGDCSSYLNAFTLWRTQAPIYESVPDEFANAYIEYRILLRDASDTTNVIRRRCPAVFPDPDFDRSNPGDPIGFFTNAVPRVEALIQTVLSTP